MRPSRPPYSTRQLWLAATFLLLGLAVAGGRALADAECGDSEPPKATKGKCPAGHKYSAETKACVKVSCGGTNVWSNAQQACIDNRSAALVDQDFYSEARALADEGKFSDALAMLGRIKWQEQPRVLNLVGYNTRKLGDVDKGLDYYHRALDLDPNYLLAREYLGEGYLQKGDVEKAKEQLAEIGARCSGHDCQEYGKLEKAIIAHVSGDPSATTW